MKMRGAPILLLVGLVARTAPAAEASRPPAPAARVADLKASDGTLLKATYFPAAHAGPGVLLLHQVNRTRGSWDEVGALLAAAGIHALSVDMRGHGESGGTPYDKLTDAEAGEHRRRQPEDVETALAYLASRAGVARDVLGVAGAGVIGVELAVDAARRHPADVKSLALLSGETLPEGLRFLHEASGLPELFVVSDDDEYPPIVEGMELLYITASNPGRKLVHYSKAHEAPWLWYEPFDVGRVPATGGHGTDLFPVHPELPGLIAEWFVTTLLVTPGHAPADTVSSAAILDLIRTPGGVDAARQRLLEARRTDPKVTLWPEITLSTIGQGALRANEAERAVALLELNLLAYSDSADAHETLAEAYVKAGRTELARAHAEKALALLDAHAVPASSWTDTEPYRGEIRSGARKILDPGDKKGR